jgi:glycosyltransferase involved in cell wall biosynthesis
MRVLLVTGMYPTPERPGLGGFVRDQVEALRRFDDLELEVFAIEPGGNGRWVAAARELRRRYARESFDLVHAHYGLAGWSALAIRGAPHLVTFHGTDLTHPVVGRMSRALVRLIDAAAPVSVNLARLPGGGLPGAGERISAPVLPMGVNLDRFAPRDRADARQRLGLDPARPYLLFPADPARPEKRYDRASELAAAAGAELVAYEGVGPGEVPDLVNAVNAVVAPSDREGYGLAPLEALACDVPVLSTDVGIAPLALNGIGGTLCAPYNRDRWLAALKPHLSDRDPRIEGRGRAELFDRNRMAARVFEAYRELISERPS